MNEPEMIKVDKNEKMESKVDHLYFVVERRKSPRFSRKSQDLKM